MSNNLRFKRKFFILKREYSNMGNLNPKGHGKLELRNNRLKIIINIENAEINSHYDIIILEDNKSYKLGRIHTDNRHNGKAEFDVNPKDIESMGFILEKINGILILRDTNILLGGYIDKEDNSIENYIHSTTSKEEGKEEIIQEEDIDEVVQEVISEDIEAVLEEDIAEVKYIENDLDLARQENRPLVSEEEYDRAMQEMFYENEDYVQELVYDNVEEQRKEKQKNQTTNYVLNILRFFPYVEPFKIDLKGYNWWKIDIDDPREDMGFLPYFSYIAGGNHKYPLIKNTVTATELIRKHGHYLFGLYNSNETVKFYMYAIPGGFTSEDHPQRGSTGFNTWFEGQEGMGYWLLYIDPSVGRIIYPINPMIPKD